MQEKVILYHQKNFNIQQIFECGQAFRFSKVQDGVYEGVAFSRYLKIQQNADCVTLWTTQQEYEKIWRNYFDLDRDYCQIGTTFCDDKIMSMAVDFGSGIRILRQDIFECLISFIISQQNNIPRIKSIIECLCQNFGDKLIEDGKEFFTFPTLNQLKGVSIDDLAILKCGFRAKYIIDAIYKIQSGQVNLLLLANMDTQDARAELLKIHGVGNKVADCVLLFGAGKLDAFPIDVWIDRAINTFYAKENFSPAEFGPYCGIAQQYLFYYAREHKIKI